MIRPHKAWSRSPSAVVCTALVIALVYYVSFGTVSLPQHLRDQAFATALRHRVSSGQRIHPESNAGTEPPHGQTQHDPPGRLKHVISPATEVNEELCKGIATGLALDYPHRAIVGLRDIRPNVSEDEQSALEAAIARVEPVFKTQTILEYLQALPESAQDDLAMAIDGYDTWFMLRPEVVEARYHSILRDADARLAARGILGQESNGTTIKSRIVFGVDQSCWPAETQERRSCAILPMSPLYDSGSLMLPVLGMPEQARWLNAGVFMGPVGDLKRLLRGVVGLMQDGYSPDFPHRWDDQGALGDFLGEQEFARKTLAGEESELNATLGLDAAKYIVDKVGVEHGMTLDYDNRLIQNAHGSLNYLSWRQYGSTEQNMEDVASSRAPFAEYHRNDTWADMDLGINTGTHNVFPIFHMTLWKHLRKEVWPKHWIHIYGEVGELARQANTKIVKWSPRPDMTAELSWDETCSWAEKKLSPKPAVDPDEKGDALGGQGASATAATAETAEAQTTPATRPTPEPLRPEMLPRPGAQRPPERLHPREIREMQEA